MRRFLFTVGAVATLAVLTPASALAHHHSRGHAHRVHIRRFGSLDQTTPTTPTTAPSSGIGTISSFQNGVLTIQLTDGSFVAGTVTPDTSISCPATGSSQGGDESSQGGDQSSQGGDQTGDAADQSQNPSGTGTSSGDEGVQSSGGDDQGDQSSGGDDQADESSDGGDDSSSENSGSCSSSDLSAGKTVIGAELRIDSAGKTWEQIDLGS
jgi:hypothetical protein